MKRNNYDYDTMPDAKAFMRISMEKSKEEREEFSFFRHKKNTFIYWASWYFGTHFDVIDEYENENDNDTRVDTDETQKLREGETSNEN